MAEFSNSFSYALDRLQKLNRVIADEPHLRKRFIIDGHDFLQAYQPSLLFDLKGYYEGRMPTMQLSGGTTPRGAFVRLLALMVSLLAWCGSIVRRTQVLVFSADKTSSKYKGDFRLNGLYDFLASRRISFTEIFHTILGHQFVSSLWQRRRLGIYLEGLDFFYVLALKLGLLGKDSLYLSRSLDLHEFGQEAEVMRRLIRKYADYTDRNRWRVAVLTVLLKFSSAKILLTVDATRDYNEIILACHRSGIRSFAFQHGAYTKYTVGWLRMSNLGTTVKPNTLFVWSRYWKDELLRLGSYFGVQDIAIGGDPKSLGFHPEKSVSPKTEHEGINILLPYEAGAIKSEVNVFLKRFLSCSKVKIFFATRADMSAKRQIVEYGIDPDKEPRLIVLTTSRVDLRQIDLVAGTSSTILYEMVMAGKPVAYLNTNLDYSIGMVETDLVEVLNKEDSDMCARLEQIKNTNPSILIERRNRLCEDWGNLEEVLTGIIKQNGIDIRHVG